MAFKIFQIIFNKFWIMISFLFAFLFKVTQSVILVEDIPPLPERTTVPGTLDAYVNKEFTQVPESPSVENGSNGLQIQAGTNNVNQISGCTFTDITNTQRMYYIKAASEFLFYNNTFKNSQYSATEGPGIMWINYVGKMTISNCRFINIVGRGGDGHIFNVNSQQKVELTLENCEFTDCGRSNNLALINMLQAECSVKFYDCNITFNNIDNACRVIDLKSYIATFERCRFKQCGANAIYLGYNNNLSPTPSEEVTFTFKNNYVTGCNKGQFILAPMLKSKANIEGNEFDSITLDNSIMISITHDRSEIEINRNTFSNIKTSSTSGGVGINIINSNEECTIRYYKCIFNNNGALSSHGGALSFGYSNNNYANIEIIECEFHGNEATGGHGGAVAIRTSKSVTIRDCRFESNIANRQDDSSGSKGFGGGIYISTSFESNGAQCMSNLSITDCHFRNNQAYQGYGIHIQSTTTSCEPTITLNYNQFNNDHETETHPSKGGIISSELTTITKEDIEHNNKFINDSANIVHFILVDYQGNPNEVIYKPGDIEEGERIEKTNDNRNYNSTSILINVSNFIDIKYTGDFGGAIHVTNFGLKCNKIKFYNCSSVTAGGGIYVKNSKEINLDVNFERLEFEQCKANCGGAIYAYSESENNPVRIAYCIFIENEAILSTSSDEMFGGSSIYMTARKGLISFCKFSDKNGISSVKICNTLDDESSPSLLLNNNDEIVLIQNCQFITNSKTTSLFYVRGNNGVPCKIKDCKFSGKLVNGAHYIDGKSINKKGNKMVVVNCKFDEPDNNHMISVQEHFDIKNNNDKSRFSSFVPMILTVGLAVALVVSPLVAIILRKSSNVNQENEEDSDENKIIDFNI